jgi:hypothetical protein
VQEFKILPGILPEICDGHFSPDGSSFGVSDHLGNITIFGLTGRSYSGPPKQQFFRMENNRLSYDINGFSFDDNAQMLPHLVPEGSICDVYFQPLAATEHVAR